jgi:hypothetical protein
LPYDIKYQFATGNAVFSFDKTKVPAPPAPPLGAPPDPPFAVIVPLFVKVPP